MNDLIEALVFKIVAISFYSIVMPIKICHVVFYLKNTRLKMSLIG